MKGIVQNINEITDSRELMVSKPHPFVTIFIYLIIIMLTAAVTWSYFGEIDSYVKANGVVRPKQKVSTITNKTAGKIEKIFCEEGRKVKEGDVLYIIEHTALDIEKEALHRESDDAVLELSNLKKFRMSIEDGKNYFDKDVEDEKIYFNKYMKYITDYKLEEKNIDLERKNKAIEEKQRELDLKSKKEIENTLGKLTLLKQSIQQDSDLFMNSDDIYSSKFVDYMYNVKKLEDVILQREDSYKTSKALEKSSALSQKELNNAKELYESAKLDLEKYKNEYMLNINTQIENNTQALKDLEIKLENEYKGVHSSHITLDKLKADTLVQLDNSIQQMENKIESLKKNLDSINLQIEDCTVTAHKDGYLNVNVEASEGDFIQSGVEVATIVPENDSEFLVQLYLSNKDVASIKEGSKVKYHFLALPYKEYGELTGEIVKVGTDAKVDNQSGNSFYLVEASVENKTLYSYKGKEAKIKVGMACEAQVITDTKKILYYLLEKINLRD